MSKAGIGVYTEETTHFLNVDVEVRSRSRLAVLAEALPSSVFVHHVGRAGGVQLLSFSLTHVRSESQNSKVLARRLDVLARRLAVIVSGVCGPARSLWDSALSRTFDVGVQAGRAPRVHDLLLESETILLLSALRARVVITTYGADAAAPPLDASGQGPGAAA